MVKDYADFFRRQKKFMIFGMLMMALSGPGQTFFFSYFISDIRAEFFLTHSEFGALYSLATLISAFLILFTGPLIDRYKLTHYVAFILIGLGFSAILLSQAKHLAVLFIGFIAARHFGQGLCMHAMGTAFGRAYDKNRGRAIAIGQTGLPIGETLFSLFIVSLLTAFDWRMSLLATGLGVLSLALPLQVFLAKSEPDSHHDQHEDNQVVSRSRREVLRDWRFYAIMLYYIGSPTLLTALFLNQASLAQERGWPLASMALAFGVYAIVKIFFSLYIGPKIDQSSARKTLPLGVVPFVLAMVILLVFDGDMQFFGQPVLPYIYMGFVGANVGILSASISSLWPELYGTAYLGAIRSLVSTITTFGTACSPFFAGLILDTRFGFDGLIWVSLVYAIVTLPPLLWAVRERV
ncbi:MAG: MFS transporter [Parvibaculales bacterium]